MRRRRRITADTGIPAALLDFIAADWPGKSEFQQWKAWDAARRAWATAELPGGEEDLPDWAGVVPDQPWSEAKREL